MASLTDTGKVALFSLQVGRCLPGPVDAATPDVLALAQRLRSLDLVITVDTMIAHLAGSLAVPTWTLLPACADWRQASRADSPWYPTMRLFRQNQVGNWAPVLDEVRARLACVP
jgi:ADP-heptose:LPS heptosyltransferase